MRHLTSFLALPFMVTVVIPRYLLRAGEATSALDGGPPIALLGVGICLGSIGLVLFASSLLHFVRHGRGTLAPWDPPQHLVVSGPYRFVRNPMISGVIFLLFAEAALLHSAVLCGWAATFLLLNFIYIPLSEEPGLARRFGAEYAEYCQHVGRFIPRLRPWSPKTDQSSGA